MKQLLLILLTLIAAESYAAMGDPLYIVNGEVVEKSKFETLPPDVIKSIDVLNGEGAVEKYGLRGSEGVIEVTLILDTPPVFADNQTFREYIIKNTKWDNSEDFARVVLKFRLKADCTIELTEVIESTNNRFRKRVLEAFHNAPKWHSPAMNMGKAIDMDMSLRIALPANKRERQERYVLQL